MEEPFQRGRASEDITDFSDLRGLKRHAANRNPVDRSIFGMTEYQREGQQANRTGCHEPAVFLNSGEVSQKDSEHQKQDDSQQNSHELLQEALRSAGSRHCQAQRTEKECDGFHLKAHAPSGPQNSGIQPHDGRQPQEGEGNGDGRALTCRHNQLHTRQNLKDRQP